MVGRSLRKLWPVRVGCSGSRAQKWRVYLTKSAATAGTSLHSTASVAATAEAGAGAMEAGADADGRFAAAATLAHVGFIRLKQFSKGAEGSDKNFSI